MIGCVEKRPKGREHTLQPQTVVSLSIHYRKLRQKPVQTRVYANANVGRAKGVTECTGDQFFVLIRADWGFTCAWPPETREILDWQWNEKLLPYWEKLAAFGKEHGIKSFCIEMHGHQLVYNVPTLLKLRQATGPIVGANLDPSHLFWMGADPLAAIEALGDAILHVHAKDTYFNDGALNLTGRLETIGHENVKDRAWSYITLGIGHGEQWWRRFCYRLRVNGYDGWLSIEHEDIILSRMEGMRRSVDLLKSALAGEPSDYALPAT